MNPLIESAARVREHAYARYSGYRVGAAIRSESGAIYHGANLENLSYGLTLCAERAAVAAMVSAGDREILEVAVVTEDGGAPCGACLQVLFEFAPHPEAVTVWCVPEGGEPVPRTLKDLMPHGFESQAVRRTETPRG